MDTELNVNSRTTDILEVKIKDKLDFIKLQNFFLLFEKLNEKASYGLGEYIYQTHMIKTCDKNI